MTFLWILVFLQLCWCVPQDQIFDKDWQTVQMGLPFATVVKGTQIVSLTDKHVLAVQDASTGNVTYRYESETPFDASSKLLDLAGVHFATALNYEGNSSRVTLWTAGEKPPLVSQYVDLPRPIIGLFGSKIHELFAIDDTGALYGLNSTGVTLLKDGEPEAKYISARYVDTKGGSSIYMLKKKRTKETFFTVPVEGDQHPEPEYTGCRLDSSSFLQSLTQYPVCLSTSLWSYYEKSRDVRNDKLGPFYDAYHFSRGNGVLETIDEDYTVTYFEGKFSLYKIEDSLEPLAVFALDTPDKFLHYKLFVTEGNVLNIFVVTKDYEIKLLANGELKWTRDESFAYIEDAIVVDTPESFTLTAEQVQQEKSESLLVAYINRLKLNYKFLTGQSEDNFDLHYGLIKTLVVITANGKLAGFHTHRTNGTQLAWVTEQALDSLHKVGDRALGISGRGVYEIDVTDGSVKLADDDIVSDHFKTVPAKLNTDSEDSFTFSLVQTESTDFYTINIEGDQVIQGYHYTSDGVQPTWQWKVDGLLGYNTRSYGNDKVAVVGITLGSRKVLYKYLIPNLAVVTTYQNTTLTLSLTNIVTGQVYEQFTKVTDNPDSVNIVYEENFIIVTTQEIGSVDTQVTAIELFESLTPDVRKTEGIAEYSAFSNRTIVPESSSRTYTLAGISVEQVGLTYTKYNIAVKEVLFTTKTGTLVAVERSLLNGRRPLTPPAKGEMADPYSPIYNPVIIPDEKHTLSHFRKLLVSNEYRQILSIPTELESTSVVVSIDTDVFVTTVKPSASFDTLTSSFNKQVLLITIVALIAAILYTKPLSEAKKLKDSWRGY